MFKSIATVVVATVALAGCVVVPGGTFPTRPNPNLAPNYGTVTVNGGVPYTINLQAGGSINASVLGNNCRGYVTEAPDFRVNFQTLAGILPLLIAASSGGDTTLVVNDPNGNWRCDDDSGPGLNPLVQFNGPQGGQYDIWVGTYSPGAAQNATLRIN